MNESTAELSKRLEAIERTLQQLPEVTAATFILMWDEYKRGSFFGMKAKDMFEISRPPSSTQTRSSGSAAQGSLGQTSEENSTG